MATTDDDRARDAARARAGDAGRGRPVADTATQRPGAPPRRPSKPSSMWVFAPALGAFFAALALLAVQVRAGHDPALGPAEPVAQQPAPRPRRVLVRRVIRRVVVHHPPAGSPSFSSPAAVQPSGPETATPAPAPAAPAAPAPAPPPAPAPLTTQSS